MRHLLRALLSLFVVVIPPAKAQTKAGEQAVRKRPKASATLGPNTTARNWRKGWRATTASPTFKKFHVPLSCGHFKDTTITPLETTVRFLRADMAVVHSSWKIAGDQNADGAAPTPAHVDFVSGVNIREAGSASLACRSSSGEVSPSWQEPAEAIPASAWNQ
jgi:hypothetical protein